MVLTTAKMGSHQQMTAREKDIYDTYSEDLETLTFNSKPVINSMTELANEYSSDFAHIIVRCIEDKIKMVETTQKLPLLYLLDSILKNHTRPYHDLLQQNIVSIFAHVFQYVQRDQAAKVRSALHKLRLTWTDNYFSLTKLNQLDRKIQTLDPNWPIIPSNKAALENNTKPDLPNPSLRTSGQSIHINPAVFGRQPSLSTESDLDAQYKQKQIELMELKLETMRKQLSAQKDMQAIDEKQQPAVKPSFQSTSFQERDKSLGANISGVSSTSAISKLPTKGIIIDEKKLKDPRMRSKILEAINKAEGINTPTIKDRISPQTHDRSSKSKTPEPQSRTPERTSLGKSKSPLRQGNSPVPATSTTGYINTGGNYGKYKSRTPSPVRARQSPTSTSSPRYSDSSKLVSQLKGTTPPPPPRISEDIKGSTRVDKPNSSKSNKRARNDSGRKDRTNFLSAEAAADKTRKRKGDEGTLDKNEDVNTKTGPSTKKSSKYQSSSKSQKANLSKKARQSQDDLFDEESSSSPSPPPNDRENKSVDEAKRKEKLSSGINFKVKTRPNIKKEKNLFRIPKKDKGNITKEKSTRTPSPQSFTSEGPLVEFNEGRSPLKRQKRQGAKPSSANLSGTKKSKLNNKLFSDDHNSSNQVTPIEGWANVKKENPDLYRMPMMDRRGGPVGAWGIGSFKDKAQTPPGIEAFPSLFHSTLVSGITQQGQTEPQIENMLQDLRNNDPEVMLKQVIPDIVKQGQNLMKNKEITVEQFSVMMKGVFQLKEQVMMQQAEKRHDKQQIINPWQDGAVPGDSSNVNVQQSNNLGDRIPMSVGAIESSIPFPNDINPVHRPGLTLLPQASLLSMSAEQINSGPGSINQLNSNTSIGIANRDLPIAIDGELAAILDDPVKRIEIDEYPRDIRFYGETALIIMGPESKDMRELRFKNEFGSTSRRIIIDQKYIIPVEIASPGYKEFKLDDGVTHTIKIGAPTRELWIDGQWHELYFNKSGDIPIGSSIHDVFLEGPAPNVDIGSIPRNDLCAGTVQLIIDGNINTIVTIYLDSKPQIVNIAGKQHILKFVQGLKMLLINGHPFRTEFGGMPMVVYVNQMKHYLRLTALPAGVKLNGIQLWDMEGNQNVQRNVSPAPNASNKAGQFQSLAQNDSANATTSSTATDMNPPSPSTLVNDNSQEAFSATAQDNGAFDRLINMIPTTPTNLGGGLKMPIQSTSESSSGGDKSAQNCSYTSTPVQDRTKPSWKNETGEQSAIDIGKKDQEVTEPQKSVDVHNLWAQLLGAGLVTHPSTSANMAIPGLDSTTNEKSPVLKDADNDDNSEKDSETKKQANKTQGNEKKKATTKEEKGKNKNIGPIYKEIILKSHHSSIKTRQEKIIEMIYDPSALQCKNCGLRFSSSQSDTEAYSQHLDWHFRMKRREKDNAKKAESKRWYFEKIDWIVSDEIEDEKDLSEDPKSRSGSPDEVPVVPASSKPEENICPICHEEFDQFYKQDFTDFSSSEVIDAKGNANKEDDGGGRWHLKNAIRPIAIENDDQIDLSAEKYAGRVFHPQCYQDRNNTTLNETSASIDQSGIEQVSTTDMPEEGNELDIDKVKTDPFVKKESLQQESNESNIDTPMDTETSNESEKPSIKDDLKIETADIETKTEPVVKVELPDSCTDLIPPDDQSTVTNLKKEHIDADSSSTVVTPTAIGQEEEMTNQTTNEEVGHAQVSETDEVKVEPKSITDVLENDQDTSDTVKTTEGDNKTYTNAPLNKSLDGNTLMTAPTSSGLGSNLSGGIRINILPNIPSQKNTPETERNENARSVSESDDGEFDKGAEFDPDAIVQDASPEQVDSKPKLKGRTMAELPMQRKGGELSSLCSIM